MCTGTDVRGPFYIRDRVLKSHCSKSFGQIIGLVGVVEFISTVKCIMPLFATNFINNKSVMILGKALVC